jgi:hypothetical protein
MSTVGQRRARLRYPLIAGEAISPTQRLISIADYANGLSWRLDIGSWRFIPPERPCILRPQEVNGLPE